jgi:hypothetical protein
VPLPVPEVPELMVIQDASGLAVQLTSVITPKDQVPAWLGTFVEDWLRDRDGDIWYA